MRMEIWYRWDRRTMFRWHSRCIGLGDRSQSLSLNGVPVYPRFRLSLSFLSNRIASSSSLHLILYHLRTIFPSIFRLTTSWIPFSISCIILDILNYPNTILVLTTSFILALEDVIRIHSRLNIYTIILGFTFLLVFGFILSGIWPFVYTGDLAWSVFYVPKY